MADKHTHDHDHGHSHEHEPIESTEQLDAAGRSLSEALRISFVILKVIMVILVVAFLASGFKTVGSNEQALVLRFGKIVAAGAEEGQVALEPGPHWVLPYPIDEVVKIPVQTQITLSINKFWYREDNAATPGRPETVRPTLNPITEGYALTRSEQASLDLSQPAQLTESEASDYSIVHTKWQVVYQIGNIEQFFRSVYIDEVRPGQVYLDVMKASVEPLIQSIVDDAIVDALTHYTIDQALQSTDTIPRNVRQLAQTKLNAIGSGIEITSVRLTEATWPKQVREAFQAFITAGQESGKVRTEAQTYADNTLNNAAGRVARELFDAVMSNTADPNQLDVLWSQAAGNTRAAISDAKTYRTNTVTSAEASAKYLEDILPEYRKRPELVAWQIYLDALDQVLSGTQEKFVLPPSESAKGQEIRIMVNTDPSLRKRQQSTQAETTDQDASSR